MAVVLIDMFTHLLPFDEFQGRVSFCIIIVHSDYIFTIFPSYGVGLIVLLVMILIQNNISVNSCVNFMVVLKKNPSCLIY